MKFALCILITGELFAQTWGTWNGVTVGASAGNISAMNGLTIGTSAGNYASWLNLASPSGVTAITVEASCTGTGSAQTVACSAPMTVTAGDTIACIGALTGGGDPSTLYFNDVANGMYDNIEGIVHPNATTGWAATAVFVNSAGGSITPQANNWEGPSQMNLQCWALKGSRTSLVIDGGSVNQTKSQSTAATNPTSGTAAAPTYNNEFVGCLMARPTAGTTSDAAPWVPGGTVTAVGSSYPVYGQYQIQTTAAAVNCNYTSTSAKYIDSQFALLNASSPAGYRAITGLAGVPAIAKSNGASATVADLNGATTTLATIRANAAWTLSGTAGTYDTSVAPSGTGTFIAQGIPHAWGDAATSVRMSGAQTANYYTWTPELGTTGAPIWFSTFFRLGSSGTSDAQICDSIQVTGGDTDSSLFVQALYSATNGLEFFLEPAEGGHSPLLTGLSLDTDYRLQVHVAGVSERYHQLIVQSKSGSTWSVAQTLNFDVLCTVSGGTSCTTPPVNGSGTGSASSGSTSLTITSGSGTIAAGQVVIPITGIPYITQVESISGTCSSSCTVTLSQATSAAISGTVQFTTKPTELKASTNGTASANSTAVTVVAPGNGTIVQYANVGGTGIAVGTYVATVSGTSVTLSQPTTAAITNGGLSFWTPGGSAGLGFMGISFGKWSSCTLAGAEYFSGMHYDPTGAWGAYLPN